MDQLIGAALPRKGSRPRIRTSSRYCRAQATVRGGGFAIGNLLSTREPSSNYWTDRKASERLGRREDRMSEPRTEGKMANTLSVSRTGCFTGCGRDETKRQRESKLVGEACTVSLR